MAAKRAQHTHLGTAAVPSVAQPPARTPQWHLGQGQRQQRQVKQLSCISSTLTLLRLKSALPSPCNAQAERRPTRNVSAAKGPSPALRHHNDAQLRLDQAVWRSDQASAEIRSSTEVWLPLSSRRSCPQYYICFKPLMDSRHQPLEDMVLTQVRWQ